MPENKYEGLDLTEHDGIPMFVWDNMCSPKRPDNEKSLVKSYIDVQALIDGNFTVRARHRFGIRLESNASADERKGHPLSPKMTVTKDKDGNFVVWKFIELYRPTKPTWSCMLNEPLL